MKALVLKAGGASGALAIGSSPGGCETFKRSFAADTSPSRPKATAEAMLTLGFESDRPGTNISFLTPLS